MTSLNVLKNMIDNLSIANTKPAENAPPHRLNIALTFLIIGGGLFLQWQAAHLSSWQGILIVAIAFSFLFLPLYSLLHEAEHRLFHPNPTINDIFGFILAAFFPGSFTFLRACHLGHHRRNRSDNEMFDLYYPTDNLLLKRIYFYALYLGMFWLSVPVATLILLVSPWLLKAQLLKDTPSVSAMVDIQPWYVIRIRLESLAVVLIHLGIFFALDLNWKTYFLMYGFFAINWSSQQYIPHADSPREVMNGAHNLITNPFYSALLLNFNWHLAHHQYPNIPWIHLPKFNDETRVRPGYLKAFIRFWRGPQPLE